MTLTISNMIFKCTVEQAAFVADCADLRYEVTSDYDRKSNTSCYPAFFGGVYDMWQDRATGGGGCRIVWARGIAWISRHSGYAYADITHEVSALFKEIGCSQQAERYSDYNPNIYGTDRWVRNEKTWEWELPVPEEY